MRTDNPPSKYVLMIATVGGTPEPIVKSICEHRPERIVFVASEETRANIRDNILPDLTAVGYPVSEGQCRCLIVSDHQNMSTCIEDVKPEAEKEVFEWRKRGTEFSVVVDITGGSKCMTAALALIAHNWPCIISYVGGKERTKDGIGIVQTGQETVVFSYNPWVALGFHAIEQVQTFFNKHEYAAAAAVLDEAIKNNRKNMGTNRRVATLKSLADAYDAWECFNHSHAHTLLSNVIKNISDLHELFPRSAGIRAVLEQNVSYLEQLALSSGTPSREIIDDLAANAYRRAEEGRYDDAVARIYRAIEALAQFRLRDHGIEKTGSVPSDKVPEPLLSEWQNRISNSVLRLGLQDDYKLLNALGDEIGSRFHEMKLDERTSPLGTRNNSIMAHGFEPMSKNGWIQLWDKFQALNPDFEGPVFAVLEGTPELKTSEKEEKHTQP